MDRAHTVCSTGNMAGYGCRIGSRSRNTGAAASAAMAKSAAASHDRAPVFRRNNRRYGDFTTMHEQFNSGCTSPLPVTRHRPVHGLWPTPRQHEYKLSKLKLLLYAAPEIRRTGSGTAPCPRPMTASAILDFSQVVSGPYAAQLLGQPGRRGHQGRAGARRSAPPDFQDELFPAARCGFGSLRAGQPGQAGGLDRPEEPGRPRRDPEDRRRLRCVPGEFPARRDGPARPGL